MREKATKILLGLFIPVTVALITYYLNLEKPDVRYTLSETIPISITGDESLKSIQQLEVKNIGNSESKNIVVKINKRIISYEIIKYSQADFPEVYESRDAFELNYSLLPPQGSFRLIFNTVGEGINKDNLTIQHLKGNAVEALSGRDSIFSKYLSYLVLLIYIVAAGAGFRMLLVAGIKSESKSSHESIFKRKRPIYINSNDWEDIRKETIINYFQKSSFYFDNLEQYSPYEYLQMTKPEYFSDNEWKLAISEASLRLEEKINYIINNSYTSDRLLAILEVERPHNFKKIKWNDLINEVDKRFLDIKRSCIYSSTSSVENELNTVKPIKLSQDTWKTYVEFLEEEYFRIIYTELLQHYAPYSYIRDRKLDFLSEDKKKKLNNTAYKLEYIKTFSNVFDINNAKQILNSDKPDWITAEDHDKVIRTLGNIVSAEKLKNKYKTMNEIVTGIILNINTCLTKPDCVETDEWQHILDLQYKRNEIDKLYFLKNKIEKQLGIIHEFLNDPTVLDRIEEYDNIFAPGNFENLREIANIVKSNNEIETE